MDQNNNNISRRVFFKSAGGAGLALMAASTKVLTDPSATLNGITKEQREKDDLIIDAHIHLPSPGWNSHTSFFSSPDTSIRYLKEAGIGGARFTTWQGVLSKTLEDVRNSNEDALRLTKIYEGFLRPGVIINPLFFEDSKIWLARFADAGHKWVGELILDNHGLPYTSKEFMRLFEICAKHDYIVQMHQNPDIIKVADYFPAMKIVWAHIPSRELMQEICKRKNVWLDISGESGGLVIGQLELAVNLLGSNRLLFGTDFDGYEPRAFIDRVKTVVTKKTDRQDIFKNNLLRLLA